MCGRYTISQTERLHEIYERIENEGLLVPRFNVAPTQTVPLVLDESPRTLSSARWGLVPSWSKDSKSAARMINARAETVAKMPAFRSAFKRQRCIIPADGFYEWQRVGSGKVPHRITVGDGIFYFAGLWENWSDPASPGDIPLRTCTIITTTPNPVTAPIHDRMPVILPQEAQSTWLSRDATPEQLAALLVPHSPDGMHAYRVSGDVGKVQNQGATLIEPLGTD